MSLEMFGSNDSDKISWSAVTNVIPMVDSTTQIPSEHQVYQGDLAVYNAARRKAWVSGLQKNDTYVYYSTANTSSGSVTFYITSDGTASGSAVFTNVYTDTITITPYGNAAAYQVSAPTVSPDKKSITASITQSTAVLLGLLQFTSASNGVKCNLLVLGD